MHLSSKRFIIINIITAFFLLFAVALPIASAATDVENIVKVIQKALGWAVVLIFALAAVVFLWGVFGYITKGADDAEKKKFRGLIIYGIIAMVVMAGVWGLVGGILKFFGITETTLDQIPTLPPIK